MEGRECRAENGGKRMEVREWREENGGQGIFEKIIYLVLVKISPCLFCTESVRNIVVSIICSCKKRELHKEETCRER